MQRLKEFPEGVILFSGRITRAPAHCETSPIFCTDPTPAFFMRGTMIEIRHGHAASRLWPNATDL
jgi:hypothetical protein